MSSLLWLWHWAGAGTGLTPDPSERVSLPRYRDEDVSEARKITNRPRAWRLQNEVPKDKGRQGLHGAEDRSSDPAIAQL